MNALVRLLVVVGFIGIVASLGSALYYLSRGTEVSSGKLARALTIRIALSLVLFALLLLAWYAGLISPHAVQPGVIR